MNRNPNPGADSGLGDIEVFAPRTRWRGLTAVFIDRDVASSDSDFQPTSSRRWWARPFDARSGRRWTGWVWRQQPVACAVALAMRLASFAATLWWTAWLGFWLAGSAAPAAAGLSLAPWLAALVMLAAAAVGGAAGLLQELTMRRAFFMRAADVLADEAIGHDLAEPMFDRLRARDLLALPDHLTAAVDLVFTPLALAMGLSWLGWLFGMATAGSATLAIAVALFATGVVGVKSMTLAEPLVTAGARRMDLVSRWLDRRWFLLRWGCAQRSLDDLAQAAGRETSLMTRDSLWRGLEGYLSGFGIVFAVAGAVAAQWLFGASPNGLLAYAWTLLPIIDVALSQSRLLGQCGQADRLLDSVRQVVGADRRVEAEDDQDDRDDRDDEDDEDDDRDVSWTERWRLFDASLLDNLEPQRCFGTAAAGRPDDRAWVDAAASWARCGGMSDHPSMATAEGFGRLHGLPAARGHGVPRAYDPMLDAPVVPFSISLLRHLRLADELWGDAADDLERAGAFQVRDDGAMLSAGQRVRVLFARAVLQARERQLPLDVSHSLSALDAGALRRVREVPMLAGIEVNWGEENLALFAAVDAIAGARQATMPESQAMRGDAGPVAVRAAPGAVADDPAGRLHWRRTAVARSATRALRWFMPTGLLAAAGLFVLSPMLAAQPAGASWRFLLETVVIAVPSLSLVVSAGVLLERAMRRAALRAHAALLVAPQGDRSDLLQRLGRDFEVVTGRLAWYVHDLGWIAATGLLGVLSLLVAFGLVGAALLMAVASASFVLWRTLAPRVVSSRRVAAQGVNRYLGLSANLRRLDGLQAATRREMRRRYVARSLSVLWRTQAASIGSKGALAYYASLLGAVALAAACVVGAWLQAPREALVFVVAALSTVNRLGATLVQGLAGLMAQSLSASRLCVALAQADRGPSMGGASPAVSDDPADPAAVSTPVPAVRASVPQAEAVTMRDSSFRSRLVLPASRNPIASRPYACVELPAGSMTQLVGPSGSGKTQFLRHHAEHAASGRVLYFPRETPALIDVCEGADWRAEVELIVLRAARERQVCVFLDELSTLLPATMARQWLAGLHRCLQARGGALVVVDHRLTLERVLRVEDVVARSTVTAP